MVTFKKGDVVTRRVKSINKYHPVCVVRGVRVNTATATAYPMDMGSYHVTMGVADGHYERTIVARKGLDEW